MPEDHQGVDWSVAQRIDQLCLQFEESLLHGEKPRIENYVDQVAPQAHHLLLPELLLMELDYYSSQGEVPQRESYQQRFSDYGEIVEEIFNRHDETVNVSDEATTDSVMAPHSKAVTPQAGDARCFKNYVLLEEIARGGMGVVYQAREQGLERIVALKMILAGEWASGEHIERFYTEARAAALLDHPNIVPIFEVGEHEGQHFYSMAFIEGESLADRINRGPLPPREAASLICTVTEAVEYAHGRGIVHRDLKPANILLDKSEVAKVTDFGLAKRVEDDSGLTATGQILGTPSFMPPEQASGKVSEVTVAADIYSLGMVSLPNPPSA